MLKQMQNPAKWYGKKVAKNIDRNSIPTNYFVSVYTRRLWHVDDYITPALYTKEAHDELRKFGLDVVSEISVQDWENDILPHFDRNILERNDLAWEAGFEAFL